MNRILAFAIVACCCAGGASAQTVLSPRALDGNKYLYMNVVVNCHDFSQVKTSYATLSRLFGIYRKYGIIADFYFTDQLAQRLEWHKSGFLDSLRRANMGINIHHRAPHALTFNPAGNNSRNAPKPQLDIVTLFRQGKTSEALAQCELWERRRVNVSTGALDSTVLGGYDFIEQKSGTKPLCVGFGISGNLDTDSLAIGALYALKKYGLRATVDEHEGGADATYPFMTMRGVMSRPADFSVTRWQAGSVDSNQFWWKMVLTKDSAAYDPVRYLESQLQTLNKSQLNIANAILHETDFSYDRPPFYSAYYVSGTSGQTNTVPYDTNAFPLDRVQPWSDAQKNAIWQKYESLMQSIAQNTSIRTVTIQSLLTMLSDDRNRSITRAQCRDLASQVLSAASGTSFRMPTRNFFTIGQSTSQTTGQSTDYFSLADAYYALQRSLAEFRSSGRLPETFSIRDVAPPLGNTAGLTASTSFTWADFGAALSTQDATLAAQITSNEFVGRMPVSVAVGSRTVNMMEYLVLLARSYQAADGGALQNSQSIEAKQMAYPSALTAPAGNAMSQNGPSNWAVKPVRRIKTSPDTPTSINSHTAATTLLPAAMNITPNPASEHVSVQFWLPQRERVSVRLYSMLGSEITTVFEGECSAGAHQYLCSTTHLPQGAYFLRLHTPSSSHTQPVQVLR